MKRPLRRKAKRPAPAECPCQRDAKLASVTFHLARSERPPFQDPRYINLVRRETGTQRAFLFGSAHAEDRSIFLLFASALPPCCTDQARKALLLPAVRAQGRGIGVTSLVGMEEDEVECVHCHKRLPVNAFTTHQLEQPESWCAQCTRAERERTGNDPLKQKANGSASFSSTPVGPRRLPSHYPASPAARTPPPLPGSPLPRNYAARPSPPSHARQPPQSPSALRLRTSRCSRRSARAYPKG